MLILVVVGMAWYLIWQVTITEASDRLDAVGSGGFGISRSKMAKMIAEGEVSVNWKVATSASIAVKVSMIV